MRVLAIIILSALLLPGCAGNGGDTPVGARVLDWNHMRDRIPAQELMVESGIVLTDQAQWESWVAALPESMASRYPEEIEAVDPSDAVVVVVSHMDCRHTSQLRHAGDGALEHHVFQEEAVDCAAESLVVEVWRVPLEELGVGADDVVLLQG